MRFIYLANTHWGHPDADGLPELLNSLSVRLRQRTDLAFVLHGGNLLDRPDPQLQRQAATVFKLPLPVYLCPGGRDLGASTDTEWLRWAPDFFPDHKLEWTLDLGGILLQAVGPRPAALQPVLAERTGTPRLLCTHQPVLGAITGKGGTLADRILANRCLRGVLASHNRYRSHVERQGIPFISIGSFLEPPHPFLELAVSADGITERIMHELGPVTSPPASLDPTYSRSAINQPHDPPPPNS